MATGARKNKLPGLLYGGTLLGALSAIFWGMNVAHAAPSISSLQGTVQQGQTITVSGSNFGTKSSAAPYRWDNFEQGASGQLVTGWSGGTGSDLARYSSEVSRGSSGHSISSKHSFRPATENVSLCVNDYDNGYPLLYLDYWYRLTPLDSSGTNGRNYKPWRVWTNDITLQMNPGIFRPGNGGLFAIWDDAYPTQPPGVELWNDEDRMYGTWKHEQVIYKTSTPGVGDGVMYRYVNSRPSTPFSNTVVFRLRNVLPTEIRIGHYWATDEDPGDPISMPANTGADAYIDDLYIDRTWARVEIGNAPVYADCTHREIQIPSAWNSSQVSFTVNQGSFSNGATAYLFVTDQNNSVSQGYPITIGSQAQPQTYSVSDFLQLVVNWLTANAASDKNSDGIVNTKDLGILMSGWE
ncbi:MAG TPA: hypothetical protein PKA31_00230 [Candidatus Moranbacteria bacterium]|nr:hypothetical protein [Candidatus Moranbacteria bacterium]